MRRAILILPSILLLTTAWAAFPVASGKFSGTGHWRGPGGASGDYEVETAVTPDSLTGSYVYQKGAESHSETYTYKMTLKEGGPFFDLLDAKDKVVGSGYCYDTECFYRAELSGIVVQETLRFAKGSLEKVGSKSGPGFSVVWKEVLQAK
jgi:hypothetical protein